jgi:hypothetical protein
VIGIIDIIVNKRRVVMRMGLLVEREVMVVMVMGVRV